MKRKLSPPLRSRGVFIVGFPPTSEWEENTHTHTPLLYSMQYNNHLVKDWAPTTFRCVQIFLLKKCRKLLSIPHRQGEKLSKGLGGNIGCGDKNSTWCIEWVPQCFSHSVNSIKSILIVCQAEQIKSKTLFFRSRSRHSLALWIFHTCSASPSRVSPVILGSQAKFGSRDWTFVATKIENENMNCWSGVKTRYTL